jgi:choline dehydrogenase-like flavoprotein
MTSEIVTIADRPDLASVVARWRQLSDFHYSPNRRARETDYPINEDNSPIRIANFNGVGGGTVLYAGHFPRFHPSDFRVRSLDGVADDWPIDYATLESYYAENDRMMGVSGLEGDPAYPPKQPTMPPLPLGRAGETLARGLNKLYWHWWPSDSAIASVDYEGRAKCINLGHCTSGCAQGAKASTDITYWPAAIRAGVELRTRCRVREITTNEHGMASGALYYDADGTEHFQPAEVVIVACNGVGTPRLLLNSVSSKFPRGIANSSGLVGRNLMFHPYARIWGISTNCWTAIAARVVLVPAVLPEIMTGLRLGFSVTLIGTILGEMFAARQGLGYLLMTAIGLHDVTLIMSLTFVLTTLAVCASAALLSVDRRLRRWF